MSCCITALHPKGAGGSILLTINSGPTRAGRALGRPGASAGTPLRRQEWLFERWFRFTKIRSFTTSGAIRVAPTIFRRALIPFALELMNEPFEIAGKAGKRIRPALYESFTRLL